MLAHRKYDINKLEMHHILINRFELTIDQQLACEKYYILRWSKATLRQSMRSGTITHQGVTYLVVYKECKPTDIKSNTELVLSFRKPKKEFELPAYVLISILGKKAQEILPS